jgi:hypothetical protein
MRLLLCGTAVAVLSACVSGPPATPGRYRGYAIERCDDDGGLSVVTTAGAAIALSPVEGEKGSSAQEKALDEIIAPALADLVELRMSAVIQACGEEALAVYIPLEQAHLFDAAVHRMGAVLRDRRIAMRVVFVIGGEVVPL